MLSQPDGPCEAQRAVIVPLPQGTWSARRGPASWSDERIAAEGRPLSVAAVREMFAGEAVPGGAFEPLPGAPEPTVVPGYLQVIIDHLEDTGHYLFCLEDTWEIKTLGHGQVAVGESLPELAAALDGPEGDDEDDWDDGDESDG